MNNPAIYTDPTGYGLRKWAKRAGRKVIRKMGQQLDRGSRWAMRNAVKTVQRLPDGLVGDVFKGLFGAVYSTAAFGTMITMAPVSALIDPAWTYSYLQLTYNFTPTGQLQNKHRTGKFAKLEIFQGAPYVRDSFWARGDGRGETWGPVAFIGPTDDMTPEKELELLRHEYGHILQYEEMGGKQYQRQADDHGHDMGEFEWDADVRATERFGVPVCNYHDPLHPEEDCQY